MRFELGDSRFPPAPVSGGSQTVASVGSAVLAACQQARDHAVAMALSDAADRWPGAVAADFRLQDGAVVGPQDRRMTSARCWPAAAWRYVDVQAESAPPPKDKKTHSLHSFGAQFAEVRVDPLLGEIRLTRLVGVFDAGRVLNAKTARSQLIGGMTFGVGMALLEETMVDEATGRIVNANVSEYLLPVNADIPVIDGGAAGGRTTGRPTRSARRASASCRWSAWRPRSPTRCIHATGVRVRDLPIRLEDLLA